MARSYPSYSSLSLGKYHCYTATLKYHCWVYCCSFSKFIFCVSTIASLSKYQQIPYIVFCWVVSPGFFGCKCASPRGSLGIMYHADRLHLVHCIFHCITFHSNILISNDIITIAIIIIYDVALDLTIQDKGSSKEKLFFLGTFPK